MDIDTRKLIKKNSYLVVVLLITLMAFWLRSFPAQYGDLQALDPYYFYRMGDYVLTHNWQLPEVDTLRYYPTGVVPAEANYMSPIYMPAFAYAGLSALGMSMTYLEWAIIWPALLGAIAVFAMFFLGRELFNSRTAGFFAAFFLAVIPAFITRTSAGFFEKESIAGVFMITGMYFFVRSYKKSSWINGIFSGLSLAVMATAWGGAAYIFLLYAAFVFSLFVIQGLLLVVNYLFPGSTKTMVDSLEGLFGGALLKAYVPTILLGTFLHQIFLKHLPLSTIYMQLAFAGIGLLVIRYAVKDIGLQRLKIVKEELIPYVIPSLLVLAFVGVIFGSMFYDPFNSILQNLFGLTPYSGGLISQTVAENAPGGWSEITGKLTTAFAAPVMPYFTGISEFFAVWFFMILGGFLMVYEFFRTKNWLYVLLLVWLVSGIWSVFGMVRLTFLIGPPAAISAAFFLYWVTKRASRLDVIKSAETLKSKFKVYYVSVPLVLLIGFSLLFNFTAGFVYSQQLGPSINGPWKESMAYMAEQTPEDSVILSWWDFGYWFQTVGKRASVADGGNMVGMIDESIADWFISPTSEWDEWIPWLEEHGVTHILMDYSLPGKYGAISTIGTRGERADGFLQLQQTDSFDRGDGLTIIEFRQGSYVVWIPTDGGDSMVGNPMFLVAQGDQFVERYTITKICSNTGISVLGEADDAIPGCLYMGNLGMYYIPEGLENNIFVSLMFMDGANLPVKKVFDNSYIRIYEV
ncbi:MAG: STT3 domain-containing protein [Nanoarchaeota archaeon]